MVCFLKILENDTLLQINRKNTFFENCFNNRADYTGGAGKIGILFGPPVTGFLS